VCIVMLSEDTAIIFIRRIKGFVFKTGTECVYCEVRAESSYRLHVKVFTRLKL
jgi:hypothetical protein